MQVCFPSARATLERRGEVPAARERDSDVVCVDGYEAHEVFDQGRVHRILLAICFRHHTRNEIRPGYRKLKVKPSND